jgi:universal stress protein E
VESSLLKIFKLRPTSVVGASVCSLSKRGVPSRMATISPTSAAAVFPNLAATDLSPIGDRAVSLAADVAVASHAELHVVHAWQLPVELQLSRERRSEEEFSAELNAIREHAVEHIRSILRDAPESLHVELHVGRDAPSHAVRTAVEKLGVDLLVMGTISRTGVAGLLMGNTAEKLVDRVECSLLTVKPDDFVCPVGAD